MKKAFVINRQRLLLLFLGAVLVLFGVTRSQAARNFLGWGSPVPQQQEGTPAQGRAQKKVAAPAPEPAVPPAPATQDELLAARQRAELSRTPTSRVNLVDLLAESEVIVHGDITEVRDGIQRGVPYTQVNVRVRESLRGELGAEFSFRQFGLLRPRRISDKYTMLNVTPAGWATYQAGEEVLLFLPPAASLTGLRAPVGLAQGKFEFIAGNACSQSNNLGLFANMTVDKSLLMEREQPLLLTTQGPVNAGALLSFVQRAVSQNWVERGIMRHVQK